MPNDTRPSEPPIDEDLADAAGEARGETPVAGKDDESPCSPAERAANAKQTAQRAS